MIRILMLDLGQTLIADGKLLPGVPQALTALQGFTAGDGQPLILCLASDFQMPEPRTPAAIDAAFRDYLEILNGLDLTRFFEPVEQHVTLSTQAGVLKPARQFFETVLRRAGTDATLEESAFITEFGPHINACRDMGMTCLQFGVDFDDWLEVPLLVSRLIRAPDVHNLEAALRPLLAGKHDLRLESVESVTSASVRARARKLVRLEASDLGSLKGVYVELPVKVNAKIGTKGHLDVSVTPPSGQDVAEATDNVRALVANQQIAAEAGQPPASPVLPTHRVEVDARGRRLLVRRRFTAL